MIKCISLDKDSRVVRVSDSTGQAKQHTPTDGLLVILYDHRQPRVLRHRGRWVEDPSIQLTDEDLEVLEAYT